MFITPRRVVGGDSLPGPEPLDARLRDQNALDEIEMTSNLMIAASETDGPLTQQQIDEILGVGHEQ